MVKIIKSKKNVELVSDNKTFEKSVEDKIVTTEFDHTNCCSLGYDENNYLIYYKDLYGYESWVENNNDGFCIHFKNSSGLESWAGYDNKHNVIHYIDNSVCEYWKDFDENNNLIYYKNNTGVEIRFVFDENNNIRYGKFANGDIIYYNPKGIQISKEEYNKLYNK